MTVGSPSRSSSMVPHSTGLKSQWSILGLETGSIPRDTGFPNFKNDCKESIPNASQIPKDPITFPSQLPFWNPPLPRMTRNQAKMRFGNHSQETSYIASMPKRKLPQRPSALPRFPDISDLSVPVESTAEYAVVVSMYEVYNDRIFDLLSLPSNQKDLRRRHLLFKSTEASPDRKVVAGLRKVVCGSYEEALMVLETGLTERRVAGTGSNSVSSRSHGFFCVEVKRRPRGGMSNSWTGAQLTIVDLAGQFHQRLYTDSS